MFDVVGEDQKSDAVVVSDGGEGEHCGDLCDDLCFTLFDASESHGCGGIDGDPDGEFAFFDEAFDKEIACACGDVPVDESDIVAGAVGLDFVKVDAASFEDGVVFSGKSRGGFAAGNEFQSFDLSDQVALEHR